MVRKYKGSREEYEQKLGGRYGQARGAGIRKPCRFETHTAHRTRG